MLDRIDGSDRSGDEGPAWAPAVEAEAPGDEAGLSADVHAAVLALPRRQREVVVLHYLLDEDTPTIASICGISEGAVRNALFHARAALAGRLAAYVEEGAEPSDDPRARPGGAERAPTAATQPTGASRASGVSGEAPPGSGDGRSCDG